jgi:hypothetical protein
MNKNAMPKKEGFPFLTRTKRYKSITRPICGEETRRVKCMFVGLSSNELKVFCFDKKES